MDATAHQALHMARHMGRGLGELVGLLQVIANAARRLRKDAAMVSRGDEAVS
jgi:hypothetical protein